MAITVNGKKVAGVGPAGLSPYQVAKAGGYTGTEQEFNQALANMVLKTELEPRLNRIETGSFRIVDIGTINCHYCKEGDDQPVWEGSLYTTLSDDVVLKIFGDAWSGPEPYFQSYPIIFVTASTGSGEEQISILPTYYDVDRQEFKGVGFLASASQYIRYYELTITQETATFDSTRLLKTGVSPGDAWIIPDQLVNSIGTLSIANGGTGVASMTGTDYSVNRPRGIVLQSSTPSSVLNGCIVGVYE